MPHTESFELSFVNIPAALKRRDRFPVAKALRRGPENLRQYLEEAQIPTISRYDRSGPYCLPLKGRRTHKNKLKIRHDADRRLARIRQHEPKAFNNAVRVYHKKYVYGRRGRPFAGKHYERRKGEALVLPSRVYNPEASFEDIPYPCNIEETCRWVIERPLKTMQRAMHLAFPDTTCWWLDEATTDTVPNQDQELWRTYVWRFHPDEHHHAWWRDVSDSESGVKMEVAPNESMVFAVQPPWILGPQDLQNVAECTELPSCADDGTPPEASLKAEERVWGKLHDTCRSLDCHNFVLTNHHGWLFGTFSDDWTSVRTSEVKDFDAKEPTVIQSLLFWVAASLGLTGAEHWSIPLTEVAEAL